MNEENHGNQENRIAYNSNELVSDESCLNNNVQDQNNPNSESKLSHLMTFNYTLLEKLNHTDQLNLNNQNTTTHSNDSLYENETLEVEPHISNAHIHDLEEHAENVFDVNYDTPNDNNTVNHFNNVDPELQITFQQLGIDQPFLQITQNNIQRRRTADPPIQRESNLSLDWSNRNSIENSINNIYQYKYALNTIKNQHYAIKTYLTFYYEKVQPNVEMNQIQPKPFPIHEKIYSFFLSYCRSELEYSYRTIRDCFYNALNNYIENNKPALNCNSPREEYPKNIHHLLRALLRIYGYTSIKVNPIFQNEFNEWAQQLKMSNSNHSKLLCLLNVARYTALRGDSMSQIQLRDLRFKKINSENSIQNIRLICEIRVRKDKNVSQTDRFLTIYGHKNHSTCPVFFILHYLINIRAVTNIRVC